MSRIAQRFIKEQNKRISMMFTQDIMFRDLPDKTKKDVLRFAKCDDSTILVQYGAVVSELLTDCDPFNLELARNHIAEHCMNKDEFFEKLPFKFILMTNSKVIDGHHWICVAEKLEVTCSLNILDLTPVRFQ